MSFDDEPESYAIDDRLPLLDPDRVEQLRERNRRVGVWPFALEFEHEGDIPSELAPIRPRAGMRGGREEIVAIPKAPLERGDVFRTRDFDLHGRAQPQVHTYWVLGKTDSADSRWIIVERVAPGSTAPTSDELPELQRPTPELIGVALVNEHRRRGHPLTGRVIRYVWRLHQVEGRDDYDEVDASSPAEALELATEAAFGGFDPGRPTKQTSDRRTWAELAGGTALAVRPKD